MVFLVLSLRRQHHKVFITLCTRLQLVSSRKEETPVDPATSADGTSVNERWTMYWDDGAQAYYYYNETTGLKRGHTVVMNDGTRIGSDIARCLFV